jgi:hypothetical protein
MSKRIPIICPICSKISLHKISKELLAQRQKIELGIVPILVKHIVCQHMFYIYVDAHFAIRNYMLASHENQHPYMLKIEEKYLPFFEIIQDTKEVCVI